MFLPAFAADASIGELHIKHNIGGSNSSQLRMEVHLSMNVNGYKGMELRLRPRVYDNKGKWIDCEANKSNGTRINPKYDRTKYSDIYVLIFNNELGIPEDLIQKRIIQIELVDQNNKVIAKSDLAYVYGQRDPFPKSFSRNGLAGEAAFLYTRCKTWSTCSDADEASRPKEYYAIPSHQSRTNSSSSSSPTPHESRHGDMECPLCHDTGKCSTCNGKGWFEINTTGCNVAECGICHGTGKCQGCFGKGTIHY